MQWGNGSRSTGAAAMRAMTCRSTLEDMLGDPFERARFSCRRGDLRRVPFEAEAGQAAANLEMLRKGRVQLDEQRAQARIAQRAFHSADRLVLEAIDIDL